MINTDNLVFIGPGSEWFWTAVSGLVLAITFIAIYRQLALARSAAAFDQIDRLSKEWVSELSTRHQLAILESIAAGTRLDLIPAGSAAYVRGFWESTASLVRAGHVDAKVVHDDFGPVIRFWWVVLAPSTNRYRAEMQVRVMEHFDWLVERMAEMDRAESRPFNIDEAYIAATIGARIEGLRDELRHAEALRTVVVREAGSDEPPRDRPARGTSQRTVRSHARDVTA